MTASRKRRRPENKEREEEQGICQRKRRVIKGPETWTLKRMITNSTRANCCQFYAHKKKSVFVFLYLTKKNQKIRVNSNNKAKAACFPLCFIQSALCILIYSLFCKNVFSKPVFRWFIQGVFSYLMRRACRWDFDRRFLLDIKKKFFALQIL